MGTSRPPLLSGEHDRQLTRMGESSYRSSSRTRQTNSIKHHIMIF